MCESLVWPRVFSCSLWMLSSFIISVSVLDFWGDFAMNKARASMPICYSCFLSSTLTKKEISSMIWEFVRSDTSPWSWEPGIWGLRADDLEAFLADSRTHLTIKMREFSLTKWFACCKFLLIWFAKRNGLVCLSIQEQQSRTASRTTYLLSLNFSIKSPSTA